MCAHDELCGRPPRSPEPSRSHTHGDATAPFMNDIKTSERSSMGQQNLKNLMLWHIMGSTTNEEGKKEKMKCRDVPVMAILKEFCAMADGMCGRKAHRPTEVPKYEYEKHRMPIKLE